VERFQMIYVADVVVLVFHMYRV